MIKIMKTKKRIIIALGVLMLPSLVLISCNIEEPSEEPVTEIAETSTEEVSEESTEETTEEVNEAYEVWNFTEYDGSEELKFGNSHKLRNVQYYDGKTWIRNRGTMLPISDSFLAEGTGIVQTGDDDYDKGIEQPFQKFYLYEGMIVGYDDFLVMHPMITHINQLDYDGPVYLSEDECHELYYEDGVILSYETEHLKTLWECPGNLSEFEDPSNEVVNQYIRKYDAYTGEKLEEYVLPENFHEIKDISGDFALIYVSDDASRYYRRAIFRFSDESCTLLKNVIVDEWQNYDLVETENMNHYRYYNGNIYDIVNGDFTEVFEQGEKVERILIKDFEQKCNEIWDMEDNLLLYEDYDGNLLLYDIVSKEERKISDPPELKRSDDCFFKEAWLSEGHVIAAKYVEPKDEDFGWQCEIYEYDLQGNETFVTDRYGEYDSEALAGPDD